MARIAHIKRRLDNWALWKSRQASSGLGFHSVNILALDVWGRSSYNGASIPHFDEDAEETNQAVESLKLSKPHLYEMLDCIYMKDLGVRETARRTGRGESTIHQQLDQADKAIDTWLSNSAEEKVRRRATALAAERARKSSTS